MLKKIFISCCLCFVFLFADSFEFNTIKRDASGTINDNGLNIENEKAIIATGYGVNKELALNNAFKAAIEQYVGVLVDTETIMKNGTLIKDNILTASNGFIKSYKELLIDKSDGLVSVKINALVKSQKVFNKIKSLNITTISINNSEDISKRIVTKIKNNQAEKITKSNAKQDAEKILRKVVQNFFSNKSLQDIISLKITDVKIDEESVADNKVPIRITYNLLFDTQIYSQKVKQLEKTFENLGAKLYKRVDLPYFRRGELKVKNKEKVQKLTATDYGIIKNYGQGYKLDVWKFPKEWRDIYPFNNNKTIEWESIFQIILELKNNEGEVILADNITPFVYYNSMLTFHTAPQPQSSIYNYNASYQSHTNKIIYPMFARTANKRTHLKSSLNFTSTQMVDIENINNIKNITIELEEK